MDNRHKRLAAFGTLVVLVLCFFSFKFGQGCGERRVAHDTPVQQQATQQTINEVQNTYTQVVREHQEGVPLLKKPFKKSVSPSRIDVGRDSAVIRTIISPGAIGRVGNGEFPFLLRKEKRSVEVSTVHPSTSTVRRYQFDDVDEDFSVAFSADSPGDAVSLTSDRDIFRFDGFGLGAGVRHDLITPQPYGTVGGRLTLFRHLEVDAGMQLPGGVYSQLTYRF